MSINIFKKRKLYNNDDNNTRHGYFTRSIKHLSVSFLVKAICSPHINTGYMQSLQHLLDDIDCIQLIQTCKILYNDEYKRVSLQHTKYYCSQQLMVWRNLKNGRPATHTEKN